MVPERQSGVAFRVPPLDDWTTLLTIIRLQGTLGQTAFDCRDESYSHLTKTNNSSIDCSTSLAWSFDLRFFPLISLFWKFLARQTAQRRAAQPATANSTPQPLRRALSSRITRRPSAEIIE
jgi:hypothetical protein